MTTADDEIKQIEQYDFCIDKGTALASIAISLKRIADAQQVIISILRKETYKGGGGAGGPF